MDAPDLFSLIAPPDEKYREPAPVVGQKPSNQHCSPWTPDRDEALRRYNADGMSYGRMSEESIFSGLSRNAIIGRAHRLGLSGTVKPLKAKTVKVRKVASERKYVPRKQRFLSLSDEAIAELHIPVEQRKTLLQLTEHTCRWPVGEPGSGDFYFCGGESAYERPYCAHHCRIAYEPSHQPKGGGNERKRPQFKRAA